jgi:hypothetical protein
MVKMTFTVDEETASALRRTASKLKKPQSVIVREAIRDFADRADHLTSDEKKHMLRVLDRVMARKPNRTEADVDAELAEIRRTRRAGGRRTRAE